MVDSLIIPKDEIVGSPEWAERLTKVIKKDFRESERDVTLFAEHTAVAKTERIWQTVYGEGKGSWAQYCQEKLNLPVESVDALILGVGILQRAGHEGPIPAKTAEWVAAQAKPPMTHEEAGKLGGRGHKASDNYNGLSRTDRGTSSQYLADRIAAVRPDILEDMKAGRYSSVRRAAIDAGIIKPYPRFSLPDMPESAGRYLAQRVDRDWLAAMLAAYEEEITK